MSTTIDAQVHLLAQAVNVKLSFPAGAPLLLYDTIINMSDEVNMIWLQRWSVGKVLYILTRYWGLLDGILNLWYDFYTGLTPDSCRILYIAATCSVHFGIVMCSMVLILRTYAIWGKNIYVLIYLASFQFVFIVVIIFTFRQSVKSTTFEPLGLPTIVACVPKLADDKVLVISCFHMGFELNVLCLSLFKWIPQWREGSSTLLIRTLYRDGIIYFAVLFSISMANAIFVIKLFNSPYYYILMEPQRAMHSILTSRLIINLRKAAITGQGAQEYLTGTASEGLTFANGVSSESDCGQNDDHELEAA